MHNEIYTINIYIYIQYILLICGTDNITAAGEKLVEDIPTWSASPLQVLIAG